MLASAGSCSDTDSLIEPQWEEELDAICFLSLPPEVQLLVLRFLDLPDLLQVRLCRTLSKATYERIIWISIFRKQERYLPLPPEVLNVFRSKDEHLRNYPTSFLESTVTSAQRIANAWHYPRSVAPTKIKREVVGTTLLGLEMFLDRWLVVLYFEGAVYLYDTHAAGYSSTKNSTICLPAVLRSSLLETTRWTSYSLQLDSSCKTLFLALSRSAPPYMVQIYEIDIHSLASNSRLQNAIRLVRTIDSPFQRNIYGLEVTRRMIALSNSGTIEVLKWEGNFNPSSSNYGKTVIKVHPEDLEGLWNGVIAIQFVGEYLLISKTRTLEAYRYSSPDHKGICCERPLSENLRHTFPVTFRDASFSQAAVTCNAVSEEETHEMTFFAYDVIQGLFHYTVRIIIPPISSEMLPSLDVHLTSVYPLSMGLANDVNLLSRPPLSRATSTSELNDASHSPTPTHIQSENTSNSRQDHGGQPVTGARGFLSTHSLGSQGKRAIWVERKRSSTVREVQVWSRENPLFDLDGPVEIERQVIYSSESYDLRDDIMHCTFGELSGKIFLGYRSGDISFLDLDSVSM